MKKFFLSVIADGFINMPLSIVIKKELKKYAANKQTQNLIKKCVA